MTSNTGSDEQAATGRSPARSAIDQGSPEWRALWLRCVSAAHAEWDRIPYNDLAFSGGDPRKLATLLEMHYELADGEAWRRVDTFLKQCQPRI